jgi:DNA-binding MarR family transcriptional regulator
MGKSLIVAQHTAIGPEPARFGVAGCTCLRLRKATRRITQLYDAFLAPSGLTAAQFGLLATVNARDGLSIGELADRMVMDPTTLTRNLRPLQKRGLVRIVAASDDRRRRSVAATARGRAAFQKAVPMWQAAQERLEAVLGATEIQRLNAALDESLATLKLG